MTIVWYVLGFIFLYRILRLISTPFLKKAKVYRYFSPMFFTVPFLGYYEIHLGTSWDFIKNGNPSSKKIMLYLLEGLINLCESIEKGEYEPQAKFKANVFYFKESTVRKFGFTSRRLNAFEFLLFATTYFEHCILYSFAHKKPSLIPLKEIKIIICEAGDLLKYKQHFIEILYKMTGRIYNSDSREHSKVA